MLQPGNDDERGKAKLMDDDYDFVRATVLADEVRELRMKLAPNEGIEDMNATDRLKLAVAMAYREGMSESDIHAIVELKLTELEGRAVVKVDADADEVASTKPSAGQTAKACKACQHATSSLVDDHIDCAAGHGQFNDRDDGADCPDFKIIPAGSRKVGLKGKAHGVAKAKAGR